MIVISCSYCTVCNEEELFDSKRMHIAEIGTVAKSLPLLR